MHLTQKTFPAVVKTSPDPAARTFSAMITTDALDRDAEVVLPTGMDKRDFMNNPVLLWMHDAQQPIGRILALYRQDNGWAMDAQIAPRPQGFQGDWRPDAVWGLLQAGVLRGVSIGFLPTDSRPPSKKDIETYGQSVRRVITRYRLCEVSLVSVPANQEALVLAVSKGLLSSPTARDLLGVQLPVPARGEARRADPKVLYVPVAGPATSPDPGGLADLAIARAMGRLYIDE